MTVYYACRRNNHDIIELLVGTNATSNAVAINDVAKGGTDRFGYSDYAKSMHKVLHNADLPVCVGLYAKWGAGKSFMMHMLKKCFDESANEDSRTKDVLQWFEDVEPGGAARRPRESYNCRERCLFRLSRIKRMCNCFSPVMSACHLPYALATLITLSMCTHYIYDL
jgi:hypothetical protein